MVTKTILRAGGVKKEYLQQVLLIKQFCKLLKS